MAPRSRRLSTLAAGVLLLAALLSGATALAQDPAPAPSFFVDTLDVRVINVDVIVTDRSGNSITDLQQDDFELEVDGKRMPISNFYAESGGRVRETVRPIEGRPTDTSFKPIDEVEADPERRSHVVVMVDHSRIRASNRKRAFKALRQAVTQLDPQDLVAVVGVEDRLVFYSEFLFDRQAVLEILDDISKVSSKLDHTEAQRRRIFSELARGQSGGFLARSVDLDQNSLLTRIQAYAADEHARSLRSLKQLERVIATVAGAPGRRSVLYLTEGMPTRPGEGLYVEWRNRFGGGNPEAAAGMRRFDFNNDYRRAVGNFDLSQTMEKVAAKANRMGVTLYAVDAEGNHGGSVRSALTEQGATSETVSVVDANYREPLEFAAQATGGKLLRSSGTLAKELGKLIRDFDTFYSIGFRAPDDWGAGSNHNIKIKVPGKKLTVRHRTEVRIPDVDEKEAGATVAALMYQSPNNPLGIKATPGSEAPREDGNAVLPILLEIPVGSLVLVPQGETHNASVAIFVSVKDKDGNPGKVQKIPFHLNIPADKVEEAKGESAHYPLPVVLRSGDRQVAVSVRDDINGSLSTVRVDVEAFSQSF